jgi:putative ABC transport system ATP-binding protein
MVTHDEKEGAYANRLVRLLDGQIMLDKAKRCQSGINAAQIEVA